MRAIPHELLGTIPKELFLEALMIVDTPAILLDQSDEALAPHLLLTKKSIERHFLPGKEELPHLYGIRHMLTWQKAYAKIAPPDVSGQI